MKSKYSKIGKVILLCSLSFFLGAFFVDNDNAITRPVVEQAQKILGISFTRAEIDSMLEGLNEQAVNYENIRKVFISNDVPPALQFNPIPVGMGFETDKKPFKISPASKVEYSGNIEDVAFFSIGQLAELMKTKKINSMQLTTMYLERLKQYGTKLECVITLTEELAMKQAKQADEEIAKGKYRGPLHGIPFGVKDILSAKTYKTTWGSVPFKNQVIDVDATVLKKLQDAGAVLVAKLSLGELAWGDVWFGGMTKSPRNINKGSSGSSAGSASATAAGLVGFSIGSETWGSIVSPSTECGATGLRPTYGRVSRTGAMALSWSMDKLGPICRNVEDCAIVFNAIYGPDGIDQAVYDAPFNYDPGIKLTGLRVGYLKSDFENDKDSLGKIFDQATLKKLEALGAELVPMELPKLPINDISIILSAEAGAAFDELTRGGKDDLMVRQIKNAWPNVFRSSRFIPAVEYIQANRIRYMVIQDMERKMKKIDVYLAPSFAGDNLLMSNLTGHPCVVLVNGYRNDGMPHSICFMGKLFGEAKALAAAKAYQDATDFHLKKPEMNW